MPSTLDVTQKIVSLTNIQKVTGAMNLIASIRFRKLASKQKALELFERELGRWREAVLPEFIREHVPLVTENAASAKTLAVVFTSDRGLCGSHNHSVHRALDALARAAGRDGRTLELVCWGNKGAAYARRRGYHVVSHTELKGLSAASPAVRQLAQQTVERFLSGELGRVVLVYNRFVTTLRQITEVEPLLPLKRLDAGVVRAEPAFDLKLEEFAPAAGGLLVEYQIAVALAHSMVSEQAARMTAMDSATKNARDLTNLAYKERNRVRQAGITSELIEIISGKEAMKR